MIESRGGVRLGRLLLAWLAAGVILNVGEAALHGSVLAEAAKTTYAALNRPAVQGPLGLSLVIAMTFVQAMATVWLYAFMRPAFASFLSAVLSVSLFVWILSSLYAGVYLHAGFPGIFPASLVWVPVVWQLVEYTVATLVGAAIYGKVRS